MRGALLREERAEVQGAVHVECNQLAIIDQGCHGAG
jgi:hypothetical protein